ncbi:hypothetical protein ST201phi2-1p132 [Pseudomonas phage 201phi2-1]|uniref:Uncharacterized protein n=1 Tax=Pseudomonas phage 201phi2-1 TaxID=198110 RepID=B3FIZ5_BP201|nr:hypothetical protein ST201phi2-1p132 [Pseudomonas phage 201phi2-1]ABY62964.1 hypothetical protein 201phi2-1p132 [Pseudomonas phage 201phi2-1]
MFPNATLEELSLGGFYGLLLILAFNLIVLLIKVVGFNRGTYEDQKSINDTLEWLRIWGTLTILVAAIYFIVYVVPWH